MRAVDFLELKNDAETRNPEKSMRLRRRSLASGRQSSFIALIEGHIHRGGMDFTRSWKKLPLFPYPAVGKD